jgi:hypothetical protein
MNSLQREYLEAVCLDDGLNVARIMGVAYGVALAGGIALASATSVLASSFVAGVMLALNGRKIREGIEDHRLMRSYSALTESKAKCPLEYVDRIRITDERSLDSMLQRTAGMEEREWGTVHKAYNSGNEAIIFEILEPAIAEEKGIIRKRRPNSIMVRAGRDSSWASRLGYYGGIHHYHPMHGGLEGPLEIYACNFVVSTVDKADLINRVNLLTFNMPYGPELIGYNTRYTYLPADGSKRVLARASPRDIYDYLGGK